MTMKATAEVVAKCITGGGGDKGGDQRDLLVMRMTFDGLILVVR